MHISYYYRLTASSTGHFLPLICIKVIHVIQAFRLNSLSYYSHDLSLMKLRHAVKCNMGYGNSIIVLVTKWMSSCKIANHQHWKKVEPKRIHFVNSGLKGSRGGKKWSRYRILDFSWKLFPSIPLTYGMKLTLFQVDIKQSLRPLLLPLRLHLSCVNRYAVLNDYLSNHTHPTTTCNYCGRCANSLLG